MAERRGAAKDARRIVVKVGSGVVSNQGALRLRVFTEIARQVSELCDSEAGFEIDSLLPHCVKQGWITGYLKMAY